MRNSPAFLLAGVMVLGWTSLAAAQAANNRPPATGSGTPARTGTPPAATGTPPATGGQGAEAAAGEPSLWASSCASDGRSAALDCSVEQRAVVTQTGQLVTLVRVRVPADTKKPVMMVQVPLGLFLPAGVTIDVDGKNSQKLELQTCDQTGCYAGSPVSPELLAMLSSGQKLNVGFQPLNKQPIKIQMGLTGFRTAFLKIN